MRNQSFFTWHNWLASAFPLAWPLYWSSYLVTTSLSWLTRGLAYTCSWRTSPTKRPGAELGHWANLRNSGGSSTGGTCTETTANGSTLEDSVGMILDFRIEGTWHSCKMGHKEESKSGPAGTGKAAGTGNHHRRDSLEYKSSWAKHSLDNPGPGGRLSTGSGRLDPAGRFC